MQMEIARCFVTFCKQWKRNEQRIITHAYTARENEGTERDIQGVGWDMSIPLKLFLVLSGNGSLFPQTSA